MGAETRNINNIAAWCGIIWFVLIIDASFTWFLSYNMRNYIGAIFIFAGTFLLRGNNQLIVSMNRRLLFVFVFILYLYLFFFHGAFINRLMVLLPLMCIVLWNREALFKMYCLFRKFILFYAILSVGIEILVISGIWTSLPHIIMPPQDLVQENLNMVNYFYGLFRISVPETGLLLYRASGPLREGGHFAIFIGFLYFVEVIVFSKRNIWLIICGFLTLSPNFILFFLVTEGYCAIKQKRLFKSIAGLVFTLIVIVTAFILSPQNIKDEIYRIVLERSLENALINTQFDGYMAFLNSRADMDGMMMYERFENNANINDYLFGFNNVPVKFVLSDIRYLIMYYGYIGLFLLLICTLFFSVGDKKSLYGLALFFLAFLVMLQRSWMFENVYIWAMMLLATNVRSKVKYQIKTHG